MFENQDSKIMTLEEKKTKRLQFLHRLYELTEGSEFKYFNMFDIGSELDLDRKLTSDIAYYLRQEGLIEFRAIGGMIGITHRGIREVEKALSNPNKPTDFFPPAVNIISIGQMTNSHIQQASPGATQVVNIGPDKYEELKQVVYSLKESIDKLSLQPQQRSELEAEIVTIETQISSPKPKSTIIAECLKSIRNILEGAASGIIAYGLLNKIASLLAG